MAHLLDIFKLVVKDKNGKVLQIHEVYRADVERILLSETDKGFSVTVTRIREF